MDRGFKFWFCVWVTTQVKQDPALVVVRGGGIRVHIHGFRKLSQSAFQIELVRIRNSQIQMRAGRLGIQLDDLLEVADSLFTPFHSHEYHRKHSKRLGIVGTDFHGAPYRLLRLGKMRFTCEDQPEIDECLRVLRIVFCRLTEEFFCFFVFSQLTV